MSVAALQDGVSAALAPTPGYSFETSRQTWLLPCMYVDSLFVHFESSFGIHNFWLRDGLLAKMSVYDCWQKVMQSLQTPASSLSKCLFHAEMQAEATAFVATAILCIQCNIDRKVRLLLLARDS